MATELGVGYVSIVPETSKLAPNLAKQLGVSVKTAARAGSDAGASFGSKLAAGIGGVASKVGAVIKTTAKVGAVATAGMGASLAYVGTGYNNLEQSARASFKTILGSSDAANEMMGKIAEFGKSSPFPRQAFIQGTQQLLGFGLEAEKVIPTLGAIQDAVAATGGGAQEIEAITYALAQVQGTGKLTGQTLNQLGQYGIDAASLIGGQMGKTSEEIRKLASKPGGIPADKVFDPLVAGLTDRFGGAAANVKETWSGAIDRIKGAWRDMGSDLMEPLISKGGGGIAVGLANTVADGLRDVQARLMPYIANTLAGVTEAIAPMIETVFGGMVDAIAPVLAQLLPVVGPIVEKIGGALMYAFEALAPVLPKVAELLGTVADVLASGLAAALLVLAPVIADVVGVLADGLLDVLEALKPAIGPVAKIVQALATVFATGLTAAIKAVTPIITRIAAVLSDVLAGALETLEPMLPTLTELFEQIASVLADLFMAALEMLAPILPVIIEAFMQLLPPIMTLISELLPPLAELILALFEAFEPLIPTLTELLVAVVALLPPLVDVLVPVLQLLLAVLTPILTAITRFAAVLIQQVSNGIKTVVEWVTKLVKWFLDLFAGGENLRRGMQIVWDAIKNAVGSAASWISDKVSAIIGWFKDLPGKIKSAISTVGDKILAPFKKGYDLAKDKLQGIIDFVKDLPGKIRRGLSTLKDTLMSPFSAFVDALKSVWNNTVGKISFKVPGWVPGIGGKGWSFPKMHTGGWVPGGPGAEPIYQLQGGEYVLSRRDVADLLRPRRTPQAAAAQRIGPGVHVEHLELSDEIGIEQFFRQADFFVAQGKL